MGGFLMLVFGICVTSGLWTLVDADCSRHDRCDCSSRCERCDCSSRCERCDCTSRCERCDYDDHLLTKQARTEIRLENLEKRVFGNDEGCCDDKWVTYNHSCYFFGTTDMSFEDAENLCVNNDGHLVSIRDSDENEFIKDHLTQLSAEKFWIGMTDKEFEGLWRWVDTDDKVAFLEWGARQPNNGRVSNCGAIWASFDNKFVDEPCRNKFRPICKK